MMPHPKALRLAAQMYFGAVMDVEVELRGGGELFVVTRVHPELSVHMMIRMADGREVWVDIDIDLNSLYAPPPPGVPTQ